MLADERQRYLARGWWAGVTLPQVLERQAGLNPDRTALVAGGRRWSYRELWLGVRRAALGFAGLGLGTGDRVLLQLPNIAEFVLCYLGLQRVGAIPVLCLPRFAGRELDHLAGLSGARAWITHPRSHGDRWESVLAQVRGTHPALEVITVGGSGARDLETLLESRAGGGRDEERLDACPQDPGALCHLMPTGGTTGLPKLVPRTHDDYLCNSRFRARATGRAADDVSLIATPITHNMAIEVSLVPGWWTGGTVVLLSATTAGDILEALARERATFTILVPAQLQDLVGHPECPRANLSSLRAVAGAGDRVPPELVDLVVDRLGSPFVHVFGMSEGPCANTRLDDPPELVRGTVGFPICPGDEFRVVDEDGRPLASGEAGELVARGPGVFRGYWEAEAINRDAFLAGGFFRTGDLARIDGTGRITLAGRRKDVIVRGGEKIPGALVEQYLAAMPGVARAAVVGIPDPRLGERICAFIEAGAGPPPSPDGIAQFFRREGISLMLCPERVEVVQAFPLTPVGKLDRARLREIAAGLLALPEAASQSD